MKVWNKVKTDLIRWNKMQLSLLGRIATVKMNILPQMLYLFQTIPIVNKKEHFKSWQKDLSNFIWGGKKPRVKFKILCDTKDRGGLQLPNLEIYHEVACLTWISNWINLTNPKILAIDGFNKLFGWHAYLMYGKVKMDGLFNHHYIRKVLLKIWQKYSKFLPKERPL